MRPLEWLLLFSFSPILLLPFIPQSWRSRWLVVSAPLPLFIAILHVIVEGWRIPLILVYLFAVVIFVVRLAEIFRRQPLIQRRRGILFSVVSVLGLILCSVLAGWLLPVVTLPETTGPYSVGVVDRELMDEARNRRLMVSVWYPTRENGSPAPLTHHPDEVATALGSLSGLPGLGLHHLRYSTVAAGEGVPVLVDNAPFPVLVFSHGLVGLRLQNSSTLQELASWGYVVVAIDHTDAAAVTVFPDGEARFYDLTRFGIAAGTEPDENLVNEQVFPVWVEDQRFVYNTLETWAVEDAMFRDKLDITRIGSFGHSFGGATAFEVCLVEVRCRAAVNLDGGLYGDIVNSSAVRPILLMTSEDSNRHNEAVEEWSQTVSAATDAVYWLELPNSTHFSFTISQLLSPLLIPKDYDPRAGLRIVDKYLRLFFDVHLREADPTLLEISAENSDVQWLVPGT
jgi:predicted dienelactone hydrolase